MESVLAKKQVKVFGPKPFPEYEKKAFIKAEVRYDDECGNGHNSLGITGKIYIPNRMDCEACGMLHEEIEKAFPELKPYLKWHLTGSDGPMHYIENARYWAGFYGKTHAPDKDVEYLRSTIVFGAVPEWNNGRAPEEMSDDKLVQWLKSRLPDLLKAFKADIEALGMVY